MAELDDDSKLRVLKNRAMRLGLDLGAAPGSYLLRHGPRALPAMLSVLDQVDKLAMAEQRKLTVPLLKKVLEAGL
jgi:DnaA family protein